MYVKQQHLALISCCCYITLFMKTIIKNLVDKLEFYYSKEQAGSNYGYETNDHLLALAREQLATN